LSTLFKNKIFAITRDIGHSSEFTRLVKEFGGIPFLLPTIKLIPRNQECIFEFLRKMRKIEFDYVIFMSPNAVDILLSLADKAHEKQSVLDELKKKKIISLGPSVMNHLTGNGICTHKMPERYSSEGLLDLIKNAELKRGTKILIPRSSASSSFMYESLTLLGIQVDEFYLYSPEINRSGNMWGKFSLLLKNGKITSLIFTSPSSVKSFCEVMQETLPDFMYYCERIEALVSIGPLTTSELNSRGFSSHQAREYTIEGAFSMAKDILGSKLLNPE
jgi:uroporphyrinogen-III synthase